ncbi:MAG TPA: hypothetical protein VGC80_14705, partial [Acetobacteraceae bacterium]
MPNLASVMPAAAPAVQAAPGQAPNAATPASAAPDAPTTSDAPPATFVGQLKAALAGLARPKSGPTVTLPSADGVAQAAPDAAAESGAQTDAAAANQDSAGDTAAQIPELLAALGFMLVPQPVPPVLPDAASPKAGTSGAPASAATPSLPGTARLVGMPLMATPPGVPMGPSVAAPAVADVTGGLVATAGPGKPDALPAAAAA